MPDFWPRFLFALAYKFINGDCVLFVMGFLGGAFPALIAYGFTRFLLGERNRWWKWLIPCLLAGIAGAIAMHNVWEWWVVNVWTKPLGEPMHIVTGGKVL